MSTAFPPSMWRAHTTTVAEIERMTRRTALFLGMSVCPMWLAQWEQFKQQVQDGDQLWYFESCQESSDDSAGFCLVRAGVSVAFIPATHR